VIIELALQVQELRQFKVKFLLSLAGAQIIRLAFKKNRYSIDYNGRTNAS